MPKACKVHLPSKEDGRRTICGRERENLAVTTRLDETTCHICRREFAQHSPPSALHPAGNELPEELEWTEKQIALAQHPDVMKNLYRAMIEVGYSESYSRAHGYAVREKLWPLIKQYQESKARRQGISAARVQNELANMAFANVLDYVEINPETGEARPKGLHELTRDEAAAIAEYETEAIEREDGSVVVVLKRIKLIDKRSALIDLGKSIGMFNEKMQMVLRQENRERHVSLEEIPTDDLEQIEAILIKAQGVVKDQKKDRQALPGILVD